MKHTPQEKYDAIVIGSGIGGLTAASLLARFNNMRVLVLERHYEVGGLTHEFQRGPFSWDVGVHYVGHSVNQQLGKALFPYMTDGQLTWIPIEGVSDRFVFPGRTIDCAPSRKKYIKQLIEMYPHEKRAIRRYFRDLKRTRKWFVADYLNTFVGRGMGALFKWATRRYDSMATMTTSAYLEKNIEDAQLRAVLSARWGDLGLPPAKSAFCLHAIVEEHYLEGGLVPSGGAHRIAIYCERVIDAFGGRVMINRDVDRILVEKGRATGVVFRSLHGPDDPHVATAPLVISAVGADITYNRFLRDVADLPMRDRINALPSGYSAVILFLGLKDDPRHLVPDGANQWIFNTIDYRRHVGGIDDTGEFHPNFVFVSFPCLKSDRDDAPTAEVITFVPHALFSRWQAHPWKHRSAAYYAFKKQIEDKLLDMVDGHIPGFSELVSFRELGTPLTIEQFTGRSGGALYGIPGTPQRYRMAGRGTKTSIENLYLAGADVASLGVMGAFLGGVAAVAAINGPWGIFKLVTAGKRAHRNGTLLQCDDSHDASHDAPSNDTKFSVRLLKKIPVSESVFRLTFQMPEAMALHPGQHLKMQVDQYQWRAYSLEKIDECRTGILVDTKFGGIGARYVRGLTPGDKVVLRLPLTDYVYASRGRNICFFASSVGIAPMISILDRVRKEGGTGQYHLFFGSPSPRENFIAPLLKEFETSLNLKTTYCVDDSMGDTTVFQGRVTEAFDNSDLDATDFDHYICGNAFMVQATASKLRQLGARRIFW